MVPAKVALPIQPPGSTVDREAARSVRRKPTRMAPTAWRAGSRTAAELLSVEAEVLGSGELAQQMRRRERAAEADPFLRESFMVNDCLPRRLTVYEFSGTARVVSAATKG